MQFYRNLLVHLGADNQKLVQAVFQNVNTTITQPKQLTELVSNMDSLDWYNGAHGKSRDDFGDTCRRSVAEERERNQVWRGPVLHPRPLIKTIIDLLKPQPREVVPDPAAGTAGFLIEADRYVKSQTNILDDLDGDTRIFQIHRAFIGLGTGARHPSSGSDELPAARY
ncbi:N-6 DNA methylase [Escherichia coli]